jgi:hypothetical protein
MQASCDPVTPGPSRKHSPDTSPRIHRRSLFRACSTDRHIGWPPSLWQAVEEVSRGSELRIRRPIGVEKRRRIYRFVEASRRRWGVEDAALSPRDFCNVLLARDAIPARGSLQLVGLTPPQGSGQDSGPPPAAPALARRLRSALKSQATGRTKPTGEGQDDGRRGSVFEMGDQLPRPTEPCEASSTACRSGLPMGLALGLGGLGLG